VHELKDKQVLFFSGTILILLEDYTTTNLQPESNPET
jgi:hypothetical protein